MIFYEAPHKLLRTLDDFVQTFGSDRKISLCRELTKLHEEIIRTTVGEAAERFRETPPRGEFVLIVAGAEKSENVEMTMEDAVSLVQNRIAEGMRTKDAVKLVAEQTGIAKNALYDAVVK